MPKAKALPCLAVAVSAWMAAGCGSAPAPTPPAATHDHEHDHEHDHDHDHEHSEERVAPQTLAAGFAEIKKLLASIDDHLTAGRNAAVDDAVHMLGHGLEDLQVLLPKESLAEDARAAVKRGVNELFDCFDELDTALHAEPGKAEPPAAVRAALAPRIDAAVERIEAALRKDDTED